MTIRDLSTSYSELKILSKRSEAALLLISQVDFYETETDRKVKCIRSYNGREFKSKILSDFMKRKGIKAERYLPYHHYQNGLIEQYNSAMSDMGCSILTDSHLLQTFW